jgi:hypothetical protein
LNLGNVTLNSPTSNGQYRICDANGNAAEYQMVSLKKPNHACNLADLSDMSKIFEVRRHILYPLKNNN